MRLSLFSFYMLFGSVFLACTQPKIRKPIQKNSGGFMEESAQKNKALFEEEVIEIKNFMRLSDSLRLYHQSKSGFWYSIKTNPSSKKKQPVTGDTVTFRYAIYDLAMNQIVTFEKNGLIEYQVDQSHQQLISGLREGIKLSMPESQMRLLLPSVMAYGYRGIPGILAPNTPVLVDIYRD